jgi:TatD DNase family protein
MKIIDTHAHLDQLEELDRALEDAYKTGVEGIVAVSIDLESCRKNLEIKKTKLQPKIYLAMGMHPSEVNLNELDDCIQLIREHVSELTAIGEIGLDFWYKWVRKNKEKKDEQREVFRTFLQLAKEIGLPAVIHSRGAWRECLETAKEAGVKSAVFHWYSGPVDVLEDILTAGYYVSSTPSLFYSPQSREAISHAPIERILIETDCPVFYRAAAPEAGKNQQAEEGFQAEPKDVFKTLKAYCALMMTEEQNSLDIFNQNAKEFFKIG